MPKWMLQLIFAALWVSAAWSAAGDLQWASLGDFQLENGSVIRDCRIGYRTLGTLNRDRSNAVLFPTWFTGTSAQLEGYAGPGKMLDTSRYYVILVDSFADGVSSSPSNSKAQPRMRFPQVTIRDMVRSQYRLAAEVLKLPKLRAAELEATQSDPAWLKGQYRQQPEAAARAVTYLHSLALETPGYRVRQTPPGGANAYFAEMLKDTLNFDANDRIRQLEAMLGQDVYKAFDGRMDKAAQAVRARVLVLVDLHDHMVNPAPALDFARLLKARTVQLESDCGHLAFRCEQAKVDAEVARFLAE
jgi:homoserine O-acetyltransferase